LRESAARGIRGLGAEPPALGNFYDISKKSRTFMHVWTLNSSFKTRDEEAEAGNGQAVNFCVSKSGSTLKKEAEANSEVFDFLRSRKHF